MALSTSQSILTPVAGELHPELGSPRRYAGLTLDAWVQAGIIAVLFGALFWPNLRRLWLKTNPFWGDPNWQHACFVPLIGLYYLYVNREALVKAKIRPLLAFKWTKQRVISSLLFILAGAAIYSVAAVGGSRLLGGQVGNVQSLAVVIAVAGAFAMALDWGIGMLVFGVLLFVYGIYPGQNDYVKDLGMVITLFGVVLALCGWEVMRVAWFPIAFLICALPWPGLVYSWVAGPLQNLAAWVAVHVLRLTGANAFQTGTKINMGGVDTPLRTLNVAEACAGLRSLMTFITVAAAIGFLAVRPLWQKFIITASAVPIAIFCNVMRIAGQGILDRFNPQWSESFAHQFVGLVMLMPAFFLILGVGWLLDQLFIEEADPEPENHSRATSLAASRHITDLPTPPTTRLASRRSSLPEEL
jgi:exosortase